MSSQIVKFFNDQVLYHKLYQTRLLYSDFHTLTNKFVLNFFNRKFTHSQQICLLSVGPGSGLLELELLNNTDNIVRLDLIQPNDQYVSSMEKTFSNKKNVTIVKANYDFSLLKQKQDLILMIQVVHLLPNPINVIQSSIKSLKDKGILLILMRSNYGMEHYLAKYRKKYDFLNIPIFLTAEKISQMLTEKGIHHTTQVIQSKFDISVFLEENDHYKDLISFIFGYDFRQKDNQDWAQQIRKDFIKDAQFSPTSQKYFLDEPMLAISIEKQEIHKITQ